MKMRGFFFLSLLMLLVSGNVFAQKTKKARESLNGVWQMCFYRSNSPDVAGELKTSNSLKILTDDGRFVNMVMMPHGAIIIGEGKYKVDSDKAYTEIVEKNLHLPQLNGKKNVMQYEMKEDGIMLVKYFLREDVNGNRIDSWCYETWKKVEMPDEYPENIIR